MLDWKIKNGDDKLKEEIKECKETFDNWFNQFWSSRVTREKMLSKDSPVPSVYYKMTKSFDDVKKEYPLSAKQQCNSCGKYVDKWIETNFSFCDEYECGIHLCKDCADNFSKMADKI